MLLLHLGIPPSGHGYTPPIAVAIITVPAEKGLYGAELHLRAYYSSAPPLSKKLSVHDKKQQSPSHRTKESKIPLRISPKGPPAPAEGTALPNRNPSLHCFSPLPVWRNTRHRRSYGKKSLKHSESGGITSFSCTACHAFGGVSLYRGNPSSHPCPRCGQSNRGYLLLNSRLPE